MTYALHRACKLILLFLFLALTLSKANADPLKEQKKGAVFMGGMPPRLIRLDVVDKVRKDGLVYYRLKATVKRASGDKNGFMILLKAPTWRDAFFEIARGNPELKESLKILFPKLVGSHKKFPTLKLKYNYKLIFPGRGISSKKSRRASGSRKFIESIPFGLRPGLHEIWLESCVEMDDHPIVDVFNVVSVMTFLANIQGFLSPMGIAKVIFLKAVKKRLTCTRVDYKYDLKAKVPSLIGLAPSKAWKELDARNLAVKWVKTTCNSIKGKVTKQNPAPGKYLSARENVTVTYCVRDNSGGGGGNGGASGKYAVYVLPDKLTCCTESNGRVTYRFLYGTEGNLPSNAIRLKAGFSNYDAMKAWVCNRPVYYHYWAGNWAYIEGRKVSMLPCDINS